MKNKILLYSSSLLTIMPMITIPVSADEIKAPEGYVYYGGDEFNDNSFDTSKWFAYGSKKVTPKWTSNAYYAKFGQPEGMIQLYSPNNVVETTDEEGNGIVKITSKKTDTTITNNEGTFNQWSSGAFTSRDADIFYPLYSRIDVRMKVANDTGVWHGFWATSYKGSSTAEFDLAEFFAKRNGHDRVTQSTHIWNNELGKTQINTPNDTGYERRTTLDSEIDNNFHIYSLEIEPSPNNEDEAIITYFVDNKPTYVFTTDKETAGKYNKFITDANTDNRMDRAINLMFTGGIGGYNDDLGYPLDNLTEVESSIDYVRVFVKETEKTTSIEEIEDNSEATVVESKIPTIEKEITNDLLTEEQTEIEPVKEENPITEEQPIEEERPNTPINNDSTTETIPTTEKTNDNVTNERPTDNTNVVEDSPTQKEKPKQEKTKKKSKKESFVKAIYSFVSKLKNFFKIK